MKLFLDENLPKKLKLDLTEHSIQTVSDKGWNNKKNGELLRLMLKDRFEILRIFDKNLQYSQNFKEYPIVIVPNAEDNTKLTLQMLAPQIKEILNENLSSEPTIINAHSRF